MIIEMICYHDEQLMLSKLLNRLHIIQRTCMHVYTMVYEFYNQFITHQCIIECMVDSISTDCTDSHILL